MSSAKPIGPLACTCGVDKAVKAVIKRNNVGFLIMIDPLKMRHKITMSHYAPFKIIKKLIIATFLVNVAYFNE
jgi:hypothetical protein